jgi:hypothetical protein
VIGFLFVAPATVYGDGCFGGYSLLRRRFWWCCFAPAAVLVLLFRWWLLAGSCLILSFCFGVVAAVCW